MNKRRPQTIADWAAVGLCPSLIVLLISSLVYFLVMCVYRGGYSGRIGYIWFMFIFGAVGIARLSIQESRKYALGYAAVLGGATFVVLSRFMTVQGPLAGLSPIINGCTIALVWFLADRITFDCTLIDEEQDASGRGLLDGLTDEGAGDQDARQHATRKRGHQPGRTVLWLTAAALPIFGLGQMMLPQDERWQSSALAALAVYLFAALSLLVVTSFLGVRRYLRQRGVDMPANVSTAWLAGGVLITALMLLACFLLPQPGAMLAGVELPQSLESPDWLKPSQYGWGGETAKPDTGTPDAATAPPQAPGEEPGRAGEGESSNSSGQPGGTQAGEQGSGEQGSGEQGSQGKSSDGSSASAEKQSSGENTDAKPQGESADSPSESSPKSQAQTDEGGSKSESADGDRSAADSPPEDAQAKDAESEGAEPAQAADEKAAAEGESQNQSQSQNQQQNQHPPSPWMPSLAGMLRLLIYGVLIAILVTFAWLQRHEIAKAWQAFLAWLRGQPVTAIAGEEPMAAADASRPLMPFSAFRNPLSRRGDPREAVIVTYQAAEAWWREHGQPRKPDETPLEYSRRLRSNSDADHEALQRLTDAYNRVVYGNDSVQPPDLAAAAAVWKSFTGS